MVSAVSTVGGGSAVAVNVRQPDSSATTGTDLTAQNNANTATGSTANALTSSSRLFNDPQAGVFVSQQVDSNGNVIVSTPQVSVLAYLRIGLDAQGLPKHTDGTVA